MFHFIRVSFYLSFDSMFKFIYLISVMFHSIHFILFMFHSIRVKFIHVLINSWFISLIFHYSPFSFHLTFYSIEYFINSLFRSISASLHSCCIPLMLVPFNIWFEFKFYSFHVSFHSYFILFTICSNHVQLNSHLILCNISPGPTPF